MDGHVILNTQGVLDSAVAPAKGIRTRCPDAPSDGFVSHGDKMWAMAACCDCVRFISGWLMLIIRMCCGDYPDVYATLIDQSRRFISGWLMLIIRMCCGDYPDVLRSAKRRLLFLG
uniref:Uncharacterized protein n=1 Tax=Vitis vinifera TaxID=29760 RepID=A5BZW9_VITVI|nr:hypothetical protein VITISV_041173 [Vitis vinifera]